MKYKIQIGFLCILNTQKSYCTVPLGQHQRLRLTKSNNLRAREQWGSTNYVIITLKVCSPNLPIDYTLNTPMCCYLTVYMNIYTFYGRRMDFHLMIFGQGWALFSSCWHQNSLANFLSHQNKKSFFLEILLYRTQYHVVTI